MGRRTRKSASKASAQRSDPQVRELQELLLLTGHNTGLTKSGKINVDGINGLVTRNARTKFLQELGLPEGTSTSALIAKAKEKIAADKAASEARLQQLATQHPNNSRLQAAAATLRGISPSREVAAGPAVATRRAGTERVPEAVPAPLPAPLPPPLPAPVAFSMETLTEALNDFSGNTDAAREDTAAQAVVTQLRALTEKDGSFPEPIREPLSRLSLAKLTALDRAAKKDANTPARQSVAQEVMALTRTAVARLQPVPIAPAVTLDTLNQAAVTFAQAETGRDTDAAKALLQQVEALKKKGGVPDAAIQAALAKLPAAKLAALQAAAGEGHTAHAMLAAAYTAAKAKEDADRPFIAQGASEVISDKARLVALTNKIETELKAAFEITDASQAARAAAIYQTVSSQAAIALADAAYLQAKAAREGQPADAAANEMIGRLKQIYIDARFGHLVSTDPAIRALDEKTLQEKYNEVLVPQFRAQFERIFNAATHAASEGNSPELARKTAQDALKETLLLASIAVTPGQDTAVVSGPPVTTERDATVRADVPPPPVTEPRQPEVRQPEIAARAPAPVIAPRPPEVNHAEIARFFEMLKTGKVIPPAAIAEASPPEVRQPEITRSAPAAGAPLLAPVPRAEGATPPEPIARPDPPRRTSPDAPVAQGATLPTLLSRIPAPPRELIAQHGWTEASLKLVRDGFMHVLATEFERAEKAKAEAEKLTGPAREDGIRKAQEDISRVALTVESYTKALQGQPLNVEERYAITRVFDVVIPALRQSGGLQANQTMDPTAIKHGLGIEPANIGPVLIADTRDKLTLKIGRFSREEVTQIRDAFFDGREISRQNGGNMYLGGIEQAIADGERYGRDVSAHPNLKDKDWLRGQNYQTDPSPTELREIAERLRTGIIHSAQRARVAKAAFEKLAHNPNAALSQDERDELISRAQRVTTYMRRRGLWGGNQTLDSAEASYILGIDFAKLGWTWVRGQNQGVPTSELPSLIKPASVAGVDESTPLDTSLSPFAHLISPADRQRFENVGITGYVPPAIQTDMAQLSLSMPPMRYASMDQSMLSRLSAHPQSTHIDTKETAPTTVRYDGEYTQALAQNTPKAQEDEETPSKNNSEGRSHVA